MMRAIWAAAGMMALAVATGPARPQATAAAAVPATVDAAHPESLVAAMQQAGYKAILKKDKSGDPEIESAASGATFYVYFYGCEDNKACRSVQLYASYTVKPKLTLDKMNAWNQQNRFGAAFLDKDGDPALQFDLALEGGMPAKTLAGAIDRWANAMGSFQHAIGW